FSEDELPESLTKNVIDQLHTLENELLSLQSTWHEGHLLREGALIVIAGRPNVGKSTLMNALLGRERSIVTPIAGTTRDIIEEHFSIDGYMVRLVDTAGLRNSDCEIESEGIRRALHQLSQADITIYVIDGSVDVDDHDADQLDKLNNKKSIIVINKCDNEINKTIQSIRTKRSPLLISATHLQGLDDLKGAIVSKLGILDSPEHHALISERHRRLLISAHKDIAEAALLLKRPTPEPALAASRLRGALETLGEATGRVYHSELLNNIFSRFCIGK
ncbi:MAG: GTPase, partial [Chloroflexota bacterium]